METTADIFGWWSKAFDSSLPMWRSWSVLSQYQRDIWENYRTAVWGHFERFLQLAPTTLSQTINPWSFSLMEFTNQIKGNPVIERKILTEVAGYGSQLGTIMDFLEVLERTTGLDTAKLKDPEDQRKVERFQNLLRDINKAKRTT